jgi:hypothetical protein
MSRSLTSTRIALAAAVAAASLAFAAPAMGYPTPAEPSGQPATQQHAVLPSGHHSQGTSQAQTVKAPAATVEQSSGSSSLDDVALVAAAALLGSGITFGAMILWRRRDQPLSV